MRQRLEPDDSVSWGNIGVRPGNSDSCQVWIDLEHSDDPHVFKEVAEIFSVLRVEHLSDTSVDGEEIARGHFLRLIHPQVQEIGHPDQQPVAGGLVVARNLADEPVNRHTHADEAREKCDGALPPRHALQICIRSEGALRDEQGPGQGWEEECG